LRDIIFADACAIPDRRGGAGRLGIENEDGTANEKIRQKDCDSLTLLPDTISKKNIF
jgi:hypothetical protein